MSRGAGATGPLAGVRVLDVAIYYAAPAIATFLADLGADVVKVEQPGGEPQRRVGAFRNGHSVAWALTGRNKRSVTVDAETEEGRSLLHRLVEAADVVVLNQPPAVLERWACTYEQLAARNPRAVVVVLSVFGATGPYAGRPGNGTMAEAFGGLTHMIGEADGAPVLPSAPVGDVMSALWAANCVLAALHWRDSGGGTGQLVDVAMYEPMLTLLGTAMAEWNPGTPPPIRSGSRYPGGAPRNVYRGSDGGWVVLSAPTDAQARRVLAVIDRESEEDIARFGAAADRMAHADKIDALVAAWVAERPAVEVIAAFDAVKVPCVPVSDLATLRSDPQVVARRSLTTLVDPGVGEMVVPAPPQGFSASPAPPLRPAPQPGEHTDEVVAEWLGTPAETES